MKRFTLLFLFQIIISGLFSQTPIPAGTVSGVWDFSGSPYLINGDITVPAYSTLEIKPGVKVEMMGWYRITVEGMLKAVGSKDSLIIFTVNDTTGFSIEDTVAGGWHGIYFKYNYMTDTSMLIYCKIEYSKSLDQYYIGSAFHAENLPYFILENCEVTNNFSKIGSAVLFYKTVASLKGNRFYYNKSNAYAAFIIEADYGKCVNNIFANNRGGGINYRAMQKIDIINNLFCNNSGSGLIIEGWYVVNGDYIIANNTLCNNVPMQFELDEIYTNGFFYNNIFWGNEDINGTTGSNSLPSFYYCCIQNGINTIICDILDYDNILDSYPQFMAPSEGAGWEYDGLEADWRLKETSPCIDAGTPDTSGLNLNLPLLDLSDSARISNNRVDIGAFEYQNPIGVNPIERNTYINIFPVPAENSITILVVPYVSEPVTVELTALNGEKLLGKNFGKINRIHENIDLSDYKPGIYFVKITSGKDNYVRKIVVK